MIHARADYDRIQDPATRYGDDPDCRETWGMSPTATPIGIDEPVILFRAQDKHFVKVLDHYREMLLRDGAHDPRMVESVERHIELANRWQADNGCKTPDL